MEGVSPVRTPQVFLRIGARRDRDESMMHERRVRVRWDRSSMGAVPPELERLSANDSNPLLVFTSLAPQTSARAAVPTGPANPVLGKRYVRLERFARDTTDNLILDCAEMGPQTTSEAADATDTQLFLLSHIDHDSTAAHSEYEDVIDEFDFDSLTLDTELTPRPKPLPEPPRRLGQKSRAPRSAEDEMMLIELRPARRLETHSRESGEPLYVAETADEEYWNAVLRGFDGFCLDNAEGPDPDIYVYPDHRKDDEYDSNAEDFSGNEYPDDEDEDVYQDDESYGGRPIRVRNAFYSDNDSNDAADGVDAYSDQQGCRDGTRMYGLCYDDEYTEPSLGSGWESGDDY